MNRTSALRQLSFYLCSVFFLLIVCEAVERLWTDGSGSRWIPALALLTGSFSVTACMTVYFHATPLFDRRIGSYSKRMVKLMGAAGLVELLHLLLDFFYFISPPLLERDVHGWLFALATLVYAIGLPVLFTLPNRPSVVPGRMLYLGIPLSAAALAGLLLVLHRSLPGFAAARLDLILNGLAFLAAVSAFVYLFVRYRRRGAQALWIAAQSLGLAAAAQVLILLAGDGVGFYFLGASALHALSYGILVGHGLRLAIAEPLRERREAEERIEFLAYNDDLTGLPNRRSLHTRLNSRFEQAYSGKTALMVLNINRFKTINDSLGYEAGDRLLGIVSELLQSHVENPEEVFRTGGDEFAVVLPESGGEEALKRAHALLEEFERPVSVGGMEHYVALSAGIAVYPEDGLAADGLLQSADAAVHLAKEQGAEVKRFSRGMTTVAREKLILESDLRKGLDRGEFYLEYQPKMSVETGRILGMEALVRWNHPLRGPVSPAEFIPLAEESGLIVPLGEWVLQEACRQNKQWQDKGYEPLCMSINLSIRQFRQAGLADQIGEMLEEIGLDPQYVELEITESMTVDKDAAFEQLKRFKQIGLHISIDDFGTGYSSLHYLKNMPIDRLKIDRSFVSEVMSGQSDAAIVSTIASMAHHLKLKVTAEGVENEEQLEFLRSQKCHEAQGFLFSRPVPAGRFERMFLQQQKLG
ncbi:EAL domain-containing protein [Saccharibacillus sp. CPCC 101409]|uniref:putative bifunctional diguanylate cyclase/phosphodiesterase n=1 Tax=Saccharibacillus sp. CPCC 101409 TaxID=3058041 RepID=UPI002670E6C7|nr:EAL domain-containing protein [Saccharibacillus sp. CPCC 101409]MDO3408758.1 EAL domain-containing protein [Saccharibacillus sp. CPCC 101409]